MINNSEQHEFTIEQDSTKNTYTIYLKDKNRSLLLSFIKTGILLGATISHQYQSITFSATTVEPFLKQKNKKINTKTKNKHETALQIFYYLSKQFKYLIENQKKCFFQIKPENILIIDNRKFIYVSSEDLLDITDNKYLTIYKPFSKNQYDSPEIQELTYIPSTNITYKTIYYSLGIYIQSFLSTQALTQELSQSSTQNITHLLDHIKGTKLFYALERSLQKDHELRTLLFI